MHGACNGIFWHRPLVPWGIKRSNIIKFQLQSQFQRFLCQTLCVFSQIKDTKYIRRDFHSGAWVMPFWWDFGVLRGQKNLPVRPLWYPLLNHWTQFNQIWCVSYSHAWGMRRQNILACPLWSWWWGKRSNIIKFQLQSHFQRFYTKLRVCSHKWKIQNISDRIFILSSGSCPRGGTWGCLGVNNQIPSVRSLCYLLLNHWTKSNLI